MPSKNSINRPKQKINLNRKVHSLSKKRTERERAGLLKPARSHETSKSGQIKSVAIDLYKGELPSTGPITNKTLSKKRAKKIERNLKYIEQRKLLVDVQKKYEDGMEVDSTAALTKSKAPKKTQIAKVKDALFQALEDTTSTGLVLENGSGTTLGGPFFP
ncbi:LAFE_0G05930g1_1 [Lachancea fermentati]|uniref:LAFE_0G05930g1_1 n=1 Tax=Lachancea fermentati TaxID=4955 RepID=A0A1G4MHB3_LACFM|nr:LAFE_0G05930g1_1 [Lachancea fermentati]